VGDEVYGRLSHTGAFSEFVADVESVFAMKPHSINHSDAASVPLVGLTSWQVLVERIKLQRGQSILIHGVCDSLSSVLCFLLRKLEIAFFIAAEILMSVFFL